MKIKIKGNYIYSVEINEGNYDGTNLMTALTTAMNNVQRITSTTENLLYNNFLINYNSYTQEISFTAFKTDILPNSLKADIVQISGTDYFRLSIKHPNNLVEVNDTITIKNSSDIGVISRLNINKDLIVYVLYFFSYSTNNSILFFYIGCIKVNYVNHMFSSYIFKCN